MKNGKNNNKKISEVALFLVVIAGMFFYFKSKRNSNKPNSPATETPAAAPILLDNVAPLPSPEKSPDNVPSPQNIQTVKIEQVSTNSAKKMDPLLVKISIFHAELTNKHEANLRAMFKSENKESYMDDYLNLQKERMLHLSELMKTDRTRASTIKVNFEYHNRLYSIIGKDLYAKYLKILKETNISAQKTRILFEF
ncbi:hypothetical protein SHI21_07420 [Bacteriovorax sp. PP10]|uniref:Uncharacterized protein n=1 Tax=Bacteriovorax antarcticus TaxID=3088717 RepID=A0ABU5VSI7_9BACT|nr:hypothetical protein [Bacteriovorax sp. PP10]MEA9356023.1 hypothetical protein [Bacteriovorax sp. PP10]